MNRPRFLFEARDPDRPERFTSPDVRHVEVSDARSYPHTIYLGSLNVPDESYAALVAELTGIEAVRRMHSPCHQPGSPRELCVAGGEHADGDIPACRECGKPYPCPTTEVLPS
jgi:hypothetical protein